VGGLRLEHLLRVADYVGVGRRRFLLGFLGRGREKREWVLPEPDVPVFTGVPAVPEWVRPPVSRYRSSYR
jgi:hypothetical protein